MSRWAILIKQVMDDRELVGDREQVRWLASGRRLSMAFGRDPHVWEEGIVKGHPSAEQPPEELYIAFNDGDIHRFSREHPQINGLAWINTSVCGARGAGWCRLKTWPFTASVR